MTNRKTRMSCAFAVPGMASNKILARRHMIRAGKFPWRIHPVDGNPASDV
jgi:hypothetical protein